VTGCFIVLCDVSENHLVYEKTYSKLERREQVVDVKFHRAAGSRLVVFCRHFQASDKRQPLQLR
jgi:hypothetical protein